MHFLSLPANFFAFIHPLVKRIETWLINVLLDVIAAGPVPRHIAFEMDGNRRYARKRGFEGKTGHPVGFENMLQALKYCQRLRVQCVTVYAFSIDNFKRPKEEVDSIMELLIELGRRDEFLSEYDIRVNFLGRRELFPANVQVAVAKMENLTRHNNGKHDRIMLNVCAPYMSPDEIATAVKCVIQKAIDAGDRDGSTITEDAIDSHLSTSLVCSPPLDVFVRTSGVKRLSGFLTWQCCENTQIHMVDSLWPEFGAYDLVPILLDYQRKVWAEEKNNTVGSCPKERK